MQPYLPVGIEDFKEMIDRKYYYVDKSLFILDSFSDKVSLYTRPRRFGKTLNLSMLKYFYSLKEECSRYLFDHLAISRCSQCREHQNQYPVISFSLKNITDRDFLSAMESFSLLMQKIVTSFPELSHSDRLDTYEKEKLRLYRAGTVQPHLLADSLLFLSQCLYKQYQRRTVILIDEYDVPLNAAYENGYYEEMTGFFRTFLGSALKTNDALEKAVLTGCLRISRESIFTGLNNFSVYSLLDMKADSAFGFLPEEVNAMFTEYGFERKLSLVRKWYDGYRFGNCEIYNPWSVLKYLSDLIVSEDACPASYWANTSSNSLVLTYIRQADRRMQEEFAALMNQQVLLKRIKPDLTYREMENPENIYSFLLLTGYLKVFRQVNRNVYEIGIPNQEVKEIYENHFSDFFTSFQRQMQDEINTALLEKNANALEAALQMVLKRSISYFDNRESFYHGFLTGMLSKSSWHIESNKEAGDGRFDLLLEPENRKDPLILIECKHSKDEKDLYKDALQGGQQILQKRYFDDPRFEGFADKAGFGISFFKKRCCVSPVSLEYEEQNPGDLLKQL